MLTAAIKNIIAEHPAYGYRRILPELRERTGLRVNHKRLKRLLRGHDLGLRRRLPRAKPSATRRVISQCGGKLNLVKGESFDPLNAFSTDFTQLQYAGGHGPHDQDGIHKAWLMAMVDIESKFACGWAVGPSANRDLALRCWSRAEKHLAQLNQTTDGLMDPMSIRSIVHSDLDSVYTSYAWLRKLLLSGGVRVSYSENGAKDNPWIESLWGRFKTENRSLIAEATTLSELTAIIDSRFTYYNRERRHSALQYMPPSTYLHHRLNHEDTACNP